MTLRIGAVVVLGAIVAFLALIGRLPGMKGHTLIDLGNVQAEPRSPDAGSTPVLVELFTSEGCSSCPPADALLARLGRTQPVRGADAIVLEEHVDYWDRLGWKDPFSSEAATDRQNQYGDAFGGEQIYTPQMIVDGRAEFVGSSEGAALHAIRAASQTPKPTVQLSWEKADLLAIRIDPQTNAKPSGQTEVYLVVAESMLHSDVKHGENAGRSLEHDGVTRQFISLGKIKDFSSGFSSTVAVHPASEWNRANLRAVIFAQDRHSRQVLAVAAIPFSAS